MQGTQDTFVDIPVTIQHEASTRRLICPRGFMQNRIYVKVTAEFIYNADTISAVMEFRTDEWPKRLEVPIVQPSENEGIAIAKCVSHSQSRGRIVGEVSVNGPATSIQVVLLDRAVGGCPLRELTWAPWEKVKWKK
jgi:hypothetical protein